MGIEVTEVQTCGKCPGPPGVGGLGAGAGALSKEAMSESVLGNLGLPPLGLRSLNPTPLAGEPQPDKCQGQLFPLGFPDPFKKVIYGPENAGLVGGTHSGA